MCRGGQCPTPVCRRYVTVSRVLLIRFADNTTNVVYATQYITMSAMDYCLAIVTRCRSRIFL